jgi:uncharacterized protein YacL
MRFVFVLFGGLCGYSIASASIKYYQALTPEQLYANFGAFILLGVVLGWGTAPFFARLALAAVESFSESLQGLTLPEVLMGAGGLLFGLIVAFFANLALQQINFSVIPAVGPYLGPFLICVTTLFLALFGAYFGSRLVFIHSFRELLGQGADAKSWGSRFVILDTSVVVDGRLQAVVETGFLEGTLVLPQFVLQELQTLSDSEDSLKRSRGRRGLDALDSLRKSFGLQIESKDYAVQGVDSKLVKLAQEMKASLLTTDYNLQKVANLQNITVLNLNQLSTSLRPVVMPGEELQIKLVKDGKESHQAIGYLEDGTMIVVERARKYVGQTVLAEVSSIVQTASGRMVFARFRSAAGISVADSGEFIPLPAAQPPASAGELAS